MHGDLPAPDLIGTLSGYLLLMPLSLAHNLQLLFATVF
ncbi:hypothetical protein DFR68_102713 [Nocardia mexicana]|uniref:Uncharacterized protein n=1 Tax=Nocardia mexicana TaxID=279262 RepID=A0A370HDT7_9NOCA|nr:hypothetical protein DFR68_102713 [Nocardia mexicana]